jgi:virginiamycin B lyase
MDASGNVSSFTITTPNSYPESIAAGSDGNMWFTEEGTNRIGRLNTGLTGFSEFSLGGAPKPYGITSGADGALWFADYGSSQIDRITTSGTVMAVPYSTAPSTLPFVIVSGSDGDLWFGGCSNYLGRMTSGGALTTYAIPNGGEVSDLTVGPDGAVWFSVTTVPTQIQSIGRMSTSGVMTLYPIEATPSNPYPSGITKGPDGAIWFLELNANQVGRLQ